MLKTKFLYPQPSYAYMIDIYHSHGPPTYQCSIDLHVLFFLTSWSYATVQKLRVQLQRIKQKECKIDFFSANNL